MRNETILKGLDQSYPDSCLRFEHAHVKSLRWLPLAVRFKLDCAGLKFTLDQWQALPLSIRVDLLHLLVAETFAETAQKAGASSVEIQQDQEIERAQAAELLGCSSQEATSWLDSSTPFAKYMLRKQVAASFS